MKKIISNSFVIFAVALLAPQTIQAQGVVYLSNLSLTSAGSLAVGSNSWLAANFRTGNNVGGYLLNSVQLALTDGSGNPGNFSVMLYTDVGAAGALPGSSLGSLTGSLNPVTGGIFTYTNVSNIMLSSATHYFIVLNAGTAIANGTYNWSNAGAANYNPNGGWSSALGQVWTSNNGLSWNAISGIYPQFAINATAIPEPGILSLFALGGLGFLWQRRRL